MKPEQVPADQVRPGDLIDTGTAARSRLRRVVQVETPGECCHCHVIGRAVTEDNRSVPLSADRTVKVYDRVPEGVPA